MSLNPFNKQVLASATLLACAASTNASEGAHVHGKAFATVVAMGGIVEIEFNSAMGNLVGFEHKPHNPEQRNQLLQALRYINTLAPSLQNGSCKMQRFLITVPGLCTLTADHDQIACADLRDDAPETNQHKHTDAHDHETGSHDDHNDQTSDHEEHATHDDEHGKHGHEDATAMNHLDAVARFNYDCGDGLPKPLTIDMPFVAQFPGLETVEVSILTETGAQKRELNPSATAFVLE